MQKLNPSSPHGVPVGVGAWDSGHCALVPSQTPNRRALAWRIAANQPLLGRNEFELARARAVLRTPDGGTFARSELAPWIAIPTRFTLAEAAPETCIEFGHAVFVIVARIVVALQANAAWRTEWIRTWRTRTILVLGALRSGARLFVTGDTLRSNTNSAQTRNGLGRIAGARANHTQTIPRKQDRNAGHLRVIRQADD